jgi:phospholipid/cholesterol/gamma-HCH transport system substrate-binding protein
MAEITIRVSGKVLRITGILLGAAVLVCLFFYLWSSGIFVPKYRLSTYFPEASGVMVRSSVELDGVQVGSVSEIKLAAESASPERRIELVLSVYKRYQDAIRSDSEATLVTEGLLGDRYVSIRRGYSGSVIAPGGEIPSVPVLALPNATSFLEKTLGCLQTAKNPTENKAQVPPESTSKTQH